MNSFQRFAVRLACRVAPPLGKLLNSAGGTVERLSEQVQHYRAMSSWQRDHNHEMQAELTEALALDAGGWMGAPVVKESLSRGGQQLMRIKESYGPNTLDLELALEDRGWQRLIATSQYEFSRYGIQQLIRICRLYKIKHPLVSRGIAVSSHYVWGRGFEVSSPDETANEILKDFWNDPRNACELSPKALMEKEQSRLTDGNLFWTFFSDPKTGECLIRSIDPCEIEEIISNPDDAGDPWYYKRVWSQNVFNEDTGERGSPVLKQGWYIAMGHDVASPPEKIGGIELMMDSGTGKPVPMIHEKSGGLPKSQFGLPPIYAVLDDARAYTKFLHNWCTITDALARFAWNVETEGGAPAIATFKQVLASTLGNDGGASIEGNPAPVTGSSFITGPGNKLTPIRTAGATTEPEQGRRVLLMVASGFGLPETFFGDASTGSLATAQSLDRPTELKFREVQEIWREWAQRSSHYVLNLSLKSPKGKLRESCKARGIKPDDVVILMAHKTTVGGVRVFGMTEADAPKEDKSKIIVDVKFPSILEHDIPARINAIVEGMTLNGFQVSGIDEKIGVGLIMQELGVEDVQAVLDEMYPDWDPERIQQPDELDPTSGIDPATSQPIPGAPQAAAPVDPTQAPGKAKAHPKKVHAKEAQLARAVAAIRRAALVMQERNGHARK